MYTNSDDPRTARRRVAVAVAVGLLLFWLPLPFGSVLPAGIAALEVAAFALLAAVVLVCRRPKRLLVAVLPAGAIIFVALLGLVQTVRWPLALARAVSPLHVSLAERASALFGRPAPTHVQLSLAPHASSTLALAWVAGAALLLVATWLGAHRAPRRIVAGALLASGLFELLYGGTRWMTGAATIWDTPVPGPTGRLRGTFVNPDHCAVYLEMTLAVAFAWVWWGWARARDERAPERKVVLLAPPLAVWLALFAGIAFTGSRAGIVAAVTATVVQGLLLAAAQRRWRLGGVGVLIVAVGIGVAAVIGMQEAFGRWLATPRSELAWNDRLEVYARTVALWERFPWLGSGLGTFRDAFPLVQPAEIGGTYTHAHNDYLETLATTGVAGAAAVAIGLGAVLLALGRRLRTVRRSESRAALAAALGAMAALAVHSCFDFGLTIPANAAALLVITGCGLAVPIPPGGRNRNDRDATRRDAPAGEAGDADEMGAGRERESDLG